MATTTTRLMVTTNPVAFNPDDVIVNTFYFLQDDTQFATQCPLIAEEVEDVYEAIIGQLSDEFDWANQLYRFYDLSHPEPRAPVYEAIHGTGVAPTSANSLPREVALCLSFQADRASGIPQRRRRGRVYLGPFGQGANGDGRPTTTLRTNAVAAGQQLLDASDASAFWTWVVNSETPAGVSVVTNGWVDDEWDIQRRRGRERTLRTTFS